MQASDKIATIWLERRAAKTSVREAKLYLNTAKKSFPLIDRFLKDENLGSVEKETRLMLKYLSAAMTALGANKTATTLNMAAQELGKAKHLPGNSDWIGGRQELKKALQIFLDISKDLVLNESDRILDDIQHLLKQLSRMMDSLGLLVSANDLKYYSNKI